jgi:hypothetical protein
LVDVAAIVATDIGPPHRPIETSEPFIGALLDSFAAKNVSPAAMTEGRLPVA